MNNMPKDEELMKDIKKIIEIQLWQFGEAVCIFEDKNEKEIREVVKDMNKRMLQSTYLSIKKFRNLIIIAEKSYSQEKHLNNF